MTMREPPRRSRRAERRMRRSAATRAEIAALERRRRGLGRRAVVIGSAIAIAAIFGAVLARNAAPSDPGLVPIATREAAPPPVSMLRHDAPESLTLVEVARIIDGDTLDIRSAQTELRVRVFGIDAPEAGERCAAEAASRLAELAAAAVRLRPDTRLQDRFGRELRYLYTPDGFSIDATLVAEGLATAWREDGALRDGLVALEQEARAAGRGCLWGG
jgi:endonuclease YncB( thermonuclease family)